MSRLDYDIGVAAGMAKDPYFRPVNLNQAWGYQAGCAGRSEQDKQWIQAVWGGGQRSGGNHALHVPASSCSESGGSSFVRLLLVTAAVIAAIAIAGGDKHQHASGGVAPATLPAARSVMSP